MNRNFELGLKVYVCNKQGRYMENVYAQSSKHANLIEEVVEKDSTQCGSSVPSTPTRSRKSGSIRIDCKAAITLKKDFKLDK